MKKLKKEYSDTQLKNQVIYTIRGIQANIKRIKKIFPEAGFMELYLNGELVVLDQVIQEIKRYKGKINRNPK